MKSGPVWSRKASAWSTREDTYMELMEQVKDENTNMALKKCAAAGIPASTAAMMKSECEPTDCPPPLINGWVIGTTNEATIIDIVYKEMMRIEIFLEAIFILSASARDLLSAAVAATISIPT